MAKRKQARKRSRFIVRLDPEVCPRHAVVHVLAVLCQDRLDRLVIEQAMRTISFTALPIDERMRRSFAWDECQAGGWAHLETVVLS